MLTPCTKINSKWLKALNARQDIIKLHEEFTDKIFFDINHIIFFIVQVQLIHNVPSMSVVEQSDPVTHICTFFFFFFFHIIFHYVLTQEPGHSSPRCT